MKLSIIVCTRNRAHAITRCLDSMAEALANAAPVDAEIIVIDNRSEDNTHDTVQEWAARCAHPVRLLVGDNRGPAAGRNLGIRSAQGELIVFTDDDCRLGKDYVKNLLRHDAGDTDLVLRGGRIELGDENDLPITIKTSTIPQRWHVQSAPKESSGFGGTISSCNMAMRRKMAQAIGFFDENFGPGTLLPGADDTDYIIRAYRASIAVEYVPDVMIFHDHGRKSVADGKRTLRSYMVSVGGLYAKYLFDNPSQCRRDRSLDDYDPRASSYERPNFDLSQADKLFRCGWGALLYFFVRARGMFRNGHNLVMKPRS